MNSFSSETDFDVLLTPKLTRIVFKATLTDEQFRHQKLRCFTDTETFTDIVFKTTLGADREHAVQFAPYTRKHQYSTPKTLCQSDRR